MPATGAVSGFIDAVRQLAAVYRNDPATRRAALGSFAVTTALIGVPFTADVLRDRGAPVPPLSRWLRIGADGALAEISSYALAGACAWLLYRVWRLSGVHVFLGLAGLFGFIVLDDSLKYHEGMGEFLVGRLGLSGALGLRSQDLGELIAWGIAGAILAVPFFLSLRQRVRRSHGFVLIFLLCLAALVFFEMVFDMLHSATGSRYMGYVEDGGGMLAIALAFTCAFALYRAIRCPGLAARLPARR